MLHLVCRIKVRIPPLEMELLNGVLLYRVLVGSEWAPSFFGSVLLIPRRSLAQNALLLQLCRARTLLQTGHRGPGMFGWALFAARWTVHSHIYTHTQIQQVPGMIWCPLYDPAGEVEQARQQAELCMEKAEDDSWLDSAGQPLKVRARHILWRSYSRLADNFLEAADYREALTLLHKGHSMATECRSTLSVYKSTQRNMLTQTHLH